MTLLKKKINNKIRNSCLNRIQVINVIEIIGYACQNGAHIAPTVTHKHMDIVHARMTNRIRTMAGGYGGTTVLVRQRHRKLLV